MLAEPIRDSVALRQRISLNRETLARFLERIGHPAADHARRCGPVLSGWPGAAPIPSVQTPSSSLPCEYETGRNRKTTRDPSSYGMRRRRTTKPTDVNKPLPPLPSSPPSSSPPTIATTSNTTTYLVPTPILTAPSVGQAEEAPEHRHERRTEQEREPSIMRHRVEALRRLESRRLGSASATRVPSIIFRRIESRSRSSRRRRGGVIWLSVEGNDDRGLLSAGQEDPGALRAGEGGER